MNFDKLQYTLTPRGIPNIAEKNTETFINSRVAGTREIKSSEIGLLCV